MHGVSHEPPRKAHSAARTVATVLALAAFLLASACSGSGEERQPTPEREPVAVLRAFLDANGRTLNVTVSSCNQNPSVAVSEEEGRVVVSAEADVVSGAVQLCADIVTIELARDLGGREVVDGTSDLPIPVEQRP